MGCGTLPQSLFLWATFSLTGLVCVFSWFSAVTNIGVRPTVSDGSTVTVESHLLDFSGNLYGRHVLLEFIDHIRDEKTFSSVEELSARIAVDSDIARKILEAHP